MMNHKLLLSSTALVSAGILLSGAASAQEMRKAGIEVRLGGYTEFGARGATNDTISNGRGDRGYEFFMDNEIVVNASGSTESGVLYGSKVEIDVNGQGGDSGVDEVGLFFSGGFGRFELGRDDGAEDVMYVGGEDAQAGTGGIDGDTSNLGPLQFTDTGDAAKITYFTPRIAGFQLGASFIPSTNDAGADDRYNGGDFEGEKGVGGGINWVGVLGPVDLTLSAVGLYSECNKDCEINGVTNSNALGSFNDDQKSWAVGGLLGFGGFTFGIGYNRQDDFAPQFQDNDILNVGLKYGFGAANVSVGYTGTRFDANDLDNNNIFVASGDIGLMPGVTLKGDVSYATDDPFTNKGPGNPDVDFGEAESDDSISGVLTIQLDY